MLKKFILIFIIFCSLTLAFILPAYAASGNATTDYTGYTQIADADGLRAISDNPGGSYLLTADINMKDIAWYPLEFSGILDGNGHTIYNLGITQINEKDDTTYDGNHKEYDTYFAGLFSRTENAVIKNLKLLNVDISISVNKHAFVGGIVGKAVNTEVTGCSVAGRLYLYTTGKMFGAGGIVGFGTGSITDCKADMTLVIVDENPDERCEAFMGGILACGYCNIDGCTVNVTGYASLTGYMHTGGIVGMFHVHDLTDPGSYYIRNCTVTGTEYYFENNPDKRRYCYAVYGEIFRRDNSRSYDNTVLSFDKHEYFTYDEVLLPEMCATPEYTAIITEPSCTELGYMTYTCKTCGYSYTDDYTPPSHKLGDWVVEKPPTYFECGQQSRYCTVCGELLETEKIPQLKYQQEVKAYSLETLSLSALLPQGHPDAGLSWSSSDENIAEVDENGSLYCKGCGSVIVTCSAAEGFVFAEYDVNIKFTGDIEAKYKSSVQLTDKLPKAHPPGDIIWSSSDENIAEVDENGSLNCKGFRSATITGRTEDGSIIAEFGLNVSYAWWQWIIIVLLFGWIWY